MTMHTRPMRITAVAAACALMLPLAACGSSDPLDDTTDTSGEGGESTGTIVIGSAQFAESEIIARIYAGALNNAGIDTEVNAQIGSREVYIEALDDGSIDLVPDYTGNLLQYYDSDIDMSGADADEVYQTLVDTLPDGYTVLDMAEAEDADSLNVTREFSEEYGVTSIADLADLDIDITVGAPPEFAERSYGIPGLEEIYGVEATLTPINDSGGPSTVAALVDGDVQVADIFTTSSAIAANDLVTLDDPEHMILPQNVVPLANADVITDEVSEVLNAVQAELTTEDLISMNAKSDDDLMSAEDIAAEWLDEHDM